MLTIIYYKIIKMKKVIKLNEQDLHRIIMESVNAILEQDVEEIEEGWLGDKWNQTKTAVNTALQQSGDEKGIKDRFSDAKKNWTSQGELNKLNNLSKELSQFVDDGKLDPQMTIAQLIGGKYNNGKFGKMSAMAANRMAQIKRRGGQYN